MNWKKCDMCKITYEPFRMSVAVIRYYYGEERRGEKIKDLCKDCIESLKKWWKT
jgi:hypothetical protein